MALGCAPGTTLWNADCADFGPDPNLLPLDPESAGDARRFRF